MVPTQSMRATGYTSGNNSDAHGEGGGGKEAQFLPFVSKDKAPWKITRSVGEQSSDSRRFHWFNMMSRYNRAEAR